MKACKSWRSHENGSAKVLLLLFLLLWLLLPDPVSEWIRANRGAFVSGWFCVLVKGLVKVKAVFGGEGMPEALCQVSLDECRHQWQPRRDLAELSRRPESFVSRCGASNGRVY